MVALQGTKQMAPSVLGKKSQRAIFVEYLWLIFPSRWVLFFIWLLTLLYLHLICRMTAMAKRMQHWRAIIARSKGNIVSSNIAPSTSTVSVVQNRTFAWAYEGMPYFTPYEIFAPETSKSVMIAILFHDLNNPTSVANPKTALANPNELFASGSFHGGLWRCAYEVDSIGECSVLLYFSREAAPYAFALGTLGLAFIWPYLR